MIRVFKDWVISADAYNVQVGKMAVKIEKKTGKAIEYIQNPKYPRNTAQAIKHILDAEKKNIITRDGITLTEAYKQFLELERELSESVIKAAEKIDKHFKKEIE